MSGEPGASIDDLLEYDEEPAAPARRKSGAGGWVRDAVSVAALTAVTIFGLKIFGIGISVPVVLAGFVALLLLRRLTAWIAPPPPPRSRDYRGSGDDGEYRWGEQDLLGGAVKPWERAFSRAARDRDRLHQELLPMLGELADERLRQRHGCTRDSDPDRARALLGEPLWKLLTRKVRRNPSPRHYAGIVAELEKL